MWAYVYPLMQFLVTNGYVPGLKSAAEILGCPVGRPRPPLELLGEPHLSQLRSILAAFSSSSTQTASAVS